MACVLKEIIITINKTILSLNHVLGCEISVRVSSEYKAILLLPVHIFY